MWGPQWTSPAALLHVVDGPVRGQVKHMPEDEEATWNRNRQLEHSFNTGHKPWKYLHQNIPTSFLTYHPCSLLPHSRTCWETCLRVLHSKLGHLSTVRHHTIPIVWFQVSCLVTKRSMSESTSNPEALSSKVPTILRHKTQKNAEVVCGCVCSHSLNRLFCTNLLGPTCFQIPSTT